MKIMCVRNTDTTHHYDMPRQFCHLFFRVFLSVLLFILFLIKKLKISLLLYFSLEGTNGSFHLRRQTNIICKFTDVLITSQGRNLRLTDSICC